MSKKKTVKKKEAVEKETVEEVVEEEAEEEVVEKVKEKKKPAPQARTEEQRQIIYIGKKNTISYVLVAVTILNKHDSCNIQARGRQISKAVDVAEIARRKFLQDMVEVSTVNIGSEDIASDVEGMPPKTVSTVEIILKKK
ncbi:MAG: RNA-binding protein [Candidatus Heimdallarchaeota archaeon]|nr:RNA-binding protein [Candidatus Heimdallarchaeota archaeon]MCK4769060.1 RNA-binding protein [Candidatus Heimdallarchaeota archaeon]